MFIFKYMNCWASFSRYTSAKGTLLSCGTLWSGKLCFINRSYSSKSFLIKIPYVQLRWFTTSRPCQKKSASLVLELDSLQKSYPSLQCCHGVFIFNSLPCYMVLCFFLGGLYFSITSKKIMEWIFSLSHRCLYYYGYLFILYLLNPIHQGLILILFKHVLAKYGVLWSSNWQGVVTRFLANGRWFCSIASLATTQKNLRHRWERNLKGQAISHLKFEEGKQQKWRPPKFKWIVLLVYEGAALPNLQSS